MSDVEHLASLFLGELIGEGVARRVYAYRPDPANFVVKVQTRGSYEEHDYQNIAEWSLWCMASPDLANWLAPCVALGADGGALLQHRCEPCPTHLIPKRVPKVLGDLHRANFGVLAGKVVVTDYGRNLSLRMSANAKVMRAVKLDEFTSLGSE